MRSRVLLLALLLFAAACDSQDSRCDPPEPHQCVYFLCCDPVCTNLANGCSTVGYECLLSDSSCTCGSDHAWHCQDSSPKDMAVHVVGDMARRATD